MPTRKKKNKLLYLYGWVIRSKEKQICFLNREKQYFYFAERTGIKNPRYMTSIHHQVKWFDSKEEAKQYYIKKCQAIGSIKGIAFSRRKFHLDEKGKYDYWKNREALLR